jgi:hypothetical protein
MEFHPMTPDEIQTYLGLLGDTVQAVSVILTDGTMLTGQYVITDNPFQPLGLWAIDGSNAYFVAIPADCIASIFEQSPVGGGLVPDPLLLVPPAVQAGLELVPVPLNFFQYIEPEGEWTQGPMRFDERTMLYFDVAAISARSGGINNIGGGFLGSAQIGWENTLFGKAIRRLRRHVAEIGSHCAARRRALTLIGYVEFVDTSGVQPSSEGGPLLEVEGSKWSAAAVWRAPAGSRHLDNRWALCYFRNDCLVLGPRSWEQIPQPVRVYGDKLPRQQMAPPLGVAQCYLMARAAACFPDDKLCIAGHGPQPVLASWLSIDARKAGSSRP